MYCSTCGNQLQNGQRDCRSCGSVASDVASIGSLPARDEAAPQIRLRQVGTCPRCDYQGQGLPYFERGANLAALVALTFFTLPLFFGVSGLFYYGLRREHRVCPRCGLSWGQHGGRASMTPVRRMAPHPARPTGRSSNEGVFRGWSIVLGVLATIVLAAGLVELELMAIVVGVLMGVGAVALHRGANRVREKRRDALLTELQGHVLRLAKERRGRLTVTEVSASLGWPLRRAEKVLASLDDGWRVDSAVTSQGVIVYEFREILLGAGPSDTGHHDPDGDDLLLRPEA